MSQQESSRSKLPGWATGFGAQVIAGLIIGLIPVSYTHLTLPTKRTYTF